MAHWRRNLIVLCFSQLLTMLAFSGYHPFVPYYMQELGAKSWAEATALLAAFESGSAITMMIFAPIWGSLADRYGRKVMVVRATLFGAILAFLMGVVRSPIQLIVIRVLQGAFCGTVAAANTLVATQTPERALGKSLGIMQTTQYVGQAVGPLIGGVFADMLGYRAVFPISSGMMVVAMLAVISLVREDFRTAPRRTVHLGLRMGRQALAGIATRNTLVLLLTLSSTSFAVAVLSPVLSLYVKSLSPSSERIATLAGAITSASALTSALAALGLGHLGDLFGRKRVLLACIIGAALTYAPQALVTNVGQLLLLRALQGIFMGGVMPTANALLASSTPAARRGTVFGVASSFQSGGRAAGPMVGAGVANLWGLASPFWVTAGVFGVLGALIGALVRAEPLEDARAAEPAPRAVVAKAQIRPPSGSAS